jgi:hypothetical protein
MSDLNRELDELAEITRRVNAEMALYGQITAATAAKQKDAQMLQQYGIKNYTAATEKASAAVTDLARSVGDVASAMYRGEKGASAFNKSIDSFGSALQGAGVALALLGGPIGIVVGVVTALTGTLLKTTKVFNEQSDALYKGFQDISRAGGAASDGLLGLGQDSRKMGLGFQELDKFVSLISANSKDLVLWSGSVVEGRKNLANLSAEMAPMRQAFMNAGMTQEELNEATAGYIRLQSRLGLTQNRSMTELAHSTQQYLLQQDALTKLTGLTRKEQEDAREEVRSQERFAAVLAEMRAKGQHQAADELENSYLILRSQSKEAAQGLADISAGMLTTEAAIKSNMATQGESMRSTQKIIAGQMSGAEGARRVAAAHGRTADALGATLGKVGVYNNIFGDLAADLRLKGLADRDIEQVLANLKKDQLAQGLTGLNATDKAQDAQTKMRLAQQSSTLSLQAMIESGVTPVTSAMSSLAHAVEKASQGLLRMARFLGVDTRENTREEYAAAQAVDLAKKEILDLERKELLAQTDKEKEIINIKLKAAKKQLLNAEVAEKYATDRATGRTGAGIGGQQLRADGSIIEPYESDYQTKEMRAAPATAAAPAAPKPKAPPSAPGTAGGDTDPTQSTKRGSLIIGPKADTAGMNPELLNRLENFAAASEKPVVLNSGRRTDQYQAELWVRGNILKEPGIHMPARPKDDQNIVYKGKQYFVEGSGIGSKHLSGEAADISVGGKLSGARGPVDDLLAQYRLHRNILPKDPPHVQMFANGGVVKATPGGVPAVIGEGNSDEAVIPLKGGAVPVTFKSKVPLTLPSDLTRELENMQSQTTNDITQAVTQAVASAIGAAMQNQPRPSGVDTQAVATAISGLASKFDDMIRAGRESVDVQKKILSASY